MADYGASVAGVRRLLPTVDIEASSEPSESDVQAWLAEFTGNVARRLGNVSALTEAQVGEITVAARGLVHLGVAATVYDAHFPERAGLTDQSYGQVLWGRYSDGLDELDAEVEALTGEEAAGGADASGVPLYYFPEPAFPDNLVI